MPTPTLWHGAWACGSCGSNWQQLTAVATFTQHTRYTRLTAAGAARPAISEKANQRQETHVTLQFILIFSSFFFCCSLRHATKSKFINSQRQRRRRRRVTLKRNYSHPHGPSRKRNRNRNWFPEAGRAKLSGVCEASECVYRCVCVCSFIQKDSFAFAIRLREASYTPLSLFLDLSLSLAASIYAHHVFSFSRMTKYRLLRCNTSQGEGGAGRRGQQQGRRCNLAWAMAKILFKHLASEKFSS